MAKKHRTSGVEPVGDFRHEEARRKNNPPAGIASTYEVRERRTQHYAYDPHLDPQLQWAGKAEYTSFEVDLVSLHIHERVSTRAILEAVKKPQPQLELFADPQLPLDKQIEFYQHDVNWANRLILGDSLLVMNSLLVKEGMAGKVQMIYIDPPYGIKYSSNFQPRIDRRDVKDKDEDLTREPEQIKAYRDTWKLGIHSYLTYLRDRLLLARELLTESGSIFVQINDENLHLVRSLLDEVFERENFVSVITFRTAMTKPTILINNVGDFLLWYSKVRNKMKFRPLFVKNPSANSSRTQQLEASTLQTRYEFVYNGKVYNPITGWRVAKDSLGRLAKSERIYQSGTLRYIRYDSDFPYFQLDNLWTEQLSEQNKLYAVQTNTKVIERCILMTTDPSDLVFDPTCVRKGTRVLTPLNPPACGGKTSTPSPHAGRAGVGFIPIEQLKPCDWVYGHDGEPHRVVRVTTRQYRGTMIGLRHDRTEQTLWLTADHLVLSERRVKVLSNKGEWHDIPPEHFGRARKMRKEMTPPERLLWSRLRGEQLGVKFRRQHPIGPYIADFYARQVGLVVEVDGDTHFQSADAVEYDRQRDQFMTSLGLRVLRFTTSAIATKLVGVLKTISHACRETVLAEDPEKQWRYAEDLAIGNTVFLGLEMQPCRIIALERQETAEEVYDLEVEESHSFFTEVCAVHNCGSGTTAYCAEKWGRRWITCDTSRVALAIARQRLLTAKFDYYELADLERGPVGGFIYKTVPHITLESIAKNPEIDGIAAKYQPQIDEALTELNQILVGAGLVPAQKGRPQGSPLREWEVPREYPTDWPKQAKERHERFWSLKRKKQQEINASIQRNAPQEVLYDRPQVKRSVVRVSGPFTVEAIPVPVIEDPTQVPIPQFEEDEARHRIADPAGNYLSNMLELLRKDGVTFPGGKKMPIVNLRALNVGLLHAEGETKQNGKALRVAVSFGPQYGPVTAAQVAEAIPAARNNAYDVLIFAGFSFDPEAHAFVQKAPVKGLAVHFANIAPDVLVGDLLKTTRGSQLFTVFGQPDVEAEKQKDGNYVVTLRGVDIYDPNTGELSQVRGEDVAAWFLDTDYGGMTFHICQAFFPGGQDPWKKLQRALKAQIEPEAFEQMRSTQSFPFQPGEHQRIAVKVIDFRGNEVVRVVALNRTSYGS